MKMLLKLGITTLQGDQLQFWAIIWKRIRSNYLAMVGICRTTRRNKILYTSLIDLSQSVNKKHYFLSQPKFPFWFCNIEMKNRYVIDSVLNRCLYNVAARKNSKNRQIAKVGGDEITFMRSVLNPIHIWLSLAVQNGIAIFTKDQNKLQVWILSTD